MNEHVWEEMLSHLPAMGKTPGLEPEEHEILDWKSSGMYGSQHPLPIRIIGINWGAFKNIDAGASLVVQWLRIRLANAGDTGSSSGPGRCHMPQSNQARVPQLPKPVCLEPVFRNERSHHNEKPARHN